MKKKLICLGVLLLALTACGQKKHGKTDSSSVQKSNSAKIESFNKENRNLLEKEEEQQVFFQQMRKVFAKSRPSPIKGNNYKNWS